MKKFYLVIAALCLSVVSHGQLKPPVQADTLVIQSIKYNYSEIRRENWPCDIIVKSTTSFQFGNQVVNIKDARADRYDIKYRCEEIRFRMDDDSVLSYYEKENTSFIVYSGYEFECTNSPIHESKSLSSSNSSSNSSISLKDRKVAGAIVKPEYPVNVSGTVVVTVWVDQSGKVTKAQPGAVGTTVNDSALWNSARNAALATPFNIDSNAPALQQGTITYNFRCM